jgi:hypothetical protein
LGLYPNSVIDPTKRDSEKYRGFPTTPFSLTKQNDVGIMYFENHIDKIDFENLLVDAKKYDPNDRNKFDTTVSFLMMLVLLLETVIDKPKKEPMVKSYIPNLVN